MRPTGYATSKSSTFSSSAAIPPAAEIQDAMADFLTPLLASDELAAARRRLGPRRDRNRSGRSGTRQTY
jgi:hypothetical protein